MMKDESLKVFVSMPMNGRSKEEIDFDFNNALCEVSLYAQVSHVICVDNFSHEDAPEDAGRLWHLGRSIQQMEDADIIYFAKGWETAPGCRIEKAICEEYDLKHFTYEAYSDTRKEEWT